MRTVLCVDGDVTLEGLSTTIREAGYRCLSASNGDDAERLFVANAVDLVILHHGDPGRQGKTLATHLKSIRAVKILMLTHSVTPAAIPKSVDTLLALPASPNALLDAVASLTGPVGGQAHRVGDS